MPLLLVCILVLFHIEITSDDEVSILSKKRVYFEDVAYISNYDGDTITVDLHDKKLPTIFSEHIPVRVRGVDTPELISKDDCEKEVAKRAKIFTQEYLRRASRIDLLNVERGKYFRLVADVKLQVGSESVLLAQELLKMRLAIPYDGGTKTEHDWCL